MPPIKQPNLAALRAARAKAKAEAEAREKSAPLPTPESLDGVVEVKEEGKGNKDKGKENLDFFNQAPVAYARILKKEKEAKRRKRDSDDEEEDSDEERERRRSTIADSDDETDTPPPVKAKRGRGRPKKKEPVTRQKRRPSSRTPDSDSDSPIPTRRRRTSTPPPPPSPRNRLELTPPPPTRRRPIPTTSVSYPSTQPTRPTRGRPAKSSLPALPTQTPTATQTTITLSSSPSPLRRTPKPPSTAPATTSTISSSSDVEIIAPPRIPTPPPQDGPNPPVEILISRPSARDSRIYLRRYRQTFKKVREQWCADFGHSPIDTVLVYKGRRVFDYSTCRGLMIPMPEEGEKSKIRFLAMREGEWEGRRGMVWDEEEEEAGGRGETSEEEGEMVGLLLKGRDRQEWKISVNRNLTVARVIEKFKKQHNIDAEKEVTLQFDGEELEAEVKLADTEVEDDDCLDVLFS